MSELSAAVPAVTIDRDAQAPAAPPCDRAADAPAAPGCCPAAPRRADGDAQRRVGLSGSVLTRKMRRSANAAMATASRPPTSAWLPRALTCTVAALGNASKSACFMRPLATWSDPAARAGAHRRRFAALCARRGLRLDAGAAYHSHWLTRRAAAGWPPASSSPGRRKPAGGGRRRRGAGAGLATPAQALKRARVIAAHHARNAEGPGRFSTVADICRSPCRRQPPRVMPRQAATPPATWPGVARRMGLRRDRPA
jgi:hypothetical protein